VLHWLGYSSVDKPTDEKPRRHGVRSRLLLVVFGLWLAVLLIGATELVLRLVGYGNQDLQQDPYLGFEATSRVFVETERDGQAFYRVDPSKLKWFNPQEFPTTKGDKVFRIFCFGGSTTFGRPYKDATSFPGWLRELLRHSDRSHRYEVINVGGISYASYRVRRILQETLNYEPDLFVIYTGHNEFLEKRTYDDILSQGEAYRVLGARLYRLRTYHLLQELRGRGRPVVTQPSQLKENVVAILDAFDGLDAYHRDNALRTSIINHFRLNLEAMLAMSASARVPVILINPACNTRDFSPFKSEHAARLSEGERQRWDDAYARGLEQSQGGEFEAAADFFRQALAIDPQHAHLNFLAGKALLGAGRHSQAVASFEAAKELDVAPLRILTEMNQHIEELAASFDIPLIDLGKILEREQGDTPAVHALGNTFFHDHIHPTIKVHQQLAERIVSEMIGQKLLQPTVELSASQRESIYGDVTKRLGADFFAIKELKLGKVLFWAGKTDEAEVSLIKAKRALPKNAEVRYILGLIQLKRGELAKAHALMIEAQTLKPDLAGLASSLADVYLRQKDYARARDIYSVEIMRHPNDGNLYHNMGWALESMDRKDEAINYYQMAVKIDPALYQTHMNLGKLFAERKMVQQSATHYERAASSQPQMHLPWVNLGLLFEGQGDFDRARRCYHRALSLHPTDARLYDDIGRVLISAKKHKEACKYLGEAIRLKWSYAPAHKNLGNALMNLEKPDEAVAAYQAALSLNPDMADVQCNMGTALAKIGRTDEAVAAYRKALALEPSMQAASNLLAAVLAHRSRPDGTKLED